MSVPMDAQLPSSSRPLSCRSVLSGRRELIPRETMNREKLPTADDGTEGGVACAGCTPVRHWRRFVFI